MTDLMPTDLIISTSKKEQEQRARRIVILALVISVSITAVSVFARLQAGTSLLPSLAPVGATICSAIALGFVQRKHLGMATILLLSGFWGAVYFTIVLVSGLGILLAASGFVIALVVVAETAPHFVSRSVALNAVLAIGLVLLDIFWQGDRSPLPGIANVVIPILVGVGALIFGIVIVRQLPRYSLQAKLFVANILVIVLAVLGLTYFIGQSTSNTLTTSIGNNLHAVADIQALNIGNTLAQQINQMQAFAFNLAFQDGLTAVNANYEGLTADEIEAQFQTLNAEWDEAEYTDPIIQDRLSTSLAAELLEFRNTFRNYSDVFITDRYGTVAASTFRNDQVYYGDEDWWRTVSRGSIYISDPIVNSSSRLIFVNLAIPIFARNSFDVLGSMNVTYSLRDLRNVLLTAENDLGETGRIDILLPDNQLIRMATYTTEDVPPETRQIIDDVQNELYVILATEKEEELTSQVDVYTSANLSDIKTLSWRVITRQELQASLTPVFQQQQVLTILGLIVMIVSTIVVIFFGRLLVRPIIALTDKAKEFAQGNLDARAEVTSNDELGLLANTFNDMAAEMKSSLTNLERRVADRTRALETSIEVSRELSNILDQQELTGQVVKSVQSAFDYYHVHIYLFDEWREYLVLSGGTGDAGLAMMSANHKIAKGKGLVGRAAETNDVVLVADVEQDAQWIANPLLPETKAEAAVPIAVGDQVLGVLDVQHNVSGGLTQDDVTLLQSIAGQVAIALQNARLYQHAQSQAQRSLLINEINQKIQRSVTVEQILQVTAEELGKAMDARRTTVQLRQQQLMPLAKSVADKDNNGSQ